MCHFPTGVSLLNPNVNVSVEKPQIRRISSNPRAETAIHEYRFVPIQQFRWKKRRRERHRGPRQGKAEQDNLAKWKLEFIYPAKDSARQEQKDFGTHQSDKQIHIYSVATTRSNKDRRGGGRGRRSGSSRNLISVQYSFDCHRLLLADPVAIQFH